MGWMEGERERVRENDDIPLINIFYAKENMNKFHFYENSFFFYQNGKGTHNEMKKMKKKGEKRERERWKRKKWPFKQASQDVQIKKRDRKMRIKRSEREERKKVCKSS